MTEMGAGAHLSAGRYRLERLLGTGGMASVWLARDTRLDRQVAVKVISDTLAAEHSYLARFEREARIAAGLSHENLVRVFDYEAGSRPFIVMEYLPGSTLADRLRQHGEASPVEPEALARDLLSGLVQIHEAGIVHRDVKAANVLFRGDRSAVLTDFGIAHPEDATRLTSTGQVIGTLKYLAPELLDGKPATPRSDLYSCGIVLRGCAGPNASGHLRELIEALTRRAPERRPRSAAAALALLAGDVTAPTRPLPDETGPTRALPASSRSAPAGEATGAPPLRRIELRLTRRALMIAGAALALLLLVLSTSGGDDGAPSSPAPAPRNAPLEEQLDALDRMLREAGRR